MLAEIISFIMFYLFCPFFTSNMGLSKLGAVSGDLCFKIKLCVTSNRIHISGKFLLRVIFVFFDRK